MTSVSTSQNQDTFGFKTCTVGGVKGQPKSQPPTVSCGSKLRRSPAFCLGFQLIRREAQISFEKLFERFPNPHHMDYAPLSCTKCGLYSGAETFDGDGGIAPDIWVKLRRLALPLRSLPRQPRRHCPKYRPSRQSHQ